MSRSSAGVSWWGDGAGFEVLLFPSKWIESGETGEHGCKSLGRGGRGTGGDWLVVNINNKFLLRYCLPAKQAQAGEPTSSVLDLNRGFDGRAFLIFIGGVDETVPALLVVLLQGCEWMGLERSDSPAWGSDGLEETRSR